MSDTKSRFEPLAEDELYSILGEGLHTGWRKGVDSPVAVRIHGEIERLAPEDWDAYVRWMVWAWDVMGLKLCKTVPDTPPEAAQS